MHPVLFHWGSAIFQTYTLMISLAFFVGLGVWIVEGKRRGIAPGIVVNMALIAYFSGFLGARVLFILTQLGHFNSGEFGVFSVWEGGIVFLGGFLLAFVFLLYLMPKMGVRRRDGLDTAAPALCFAHAVGRLGCFFNGCCYGKICHLPWAVTYTNPLVGAPLGIPLHPSQLYEALALLVLGAALMRNNRAVKARLPTYKIYLVGYAVLRFFIEMTRGDLLRGFWWGLSTSQWICLALIFGALLLDFKGGPDHNTADESRNRKPLGSQ